MMEVPAESPTQVTIRWGSTVLAVCPEPGCTMITMGGTCVKHDPVTAPVYPRGRPFATADAALAAAAAG